MIISFSDRIRAQLIVCALGIGVAGACYGLWSNCRVSESSTAIAEARGQLSEASAAAAKAKAQAEAAAIRMEGAEREARAAYAQADREAQRVSAESKRAAVAEALGREKSQAERQAVIALQRLKRRTHASEGVRQAANGNLWVGMLHMAYPLVSVPDCLEAITATRDQLGGYQRSHHRMYTLRLILVHSDEVREATLSPDGRHVATYDADYKSWLWESRTGRALITAPNNFDVARPLAVSANGQQVAIRGEGKVVRVQDVRTGKDEVPPLAHNSTVYRAAFSPDGRRLLTVDGGGAARIWDTATGRVMGGVPHDDREPYAVNFSSNSQWVIINYSDGRGSRLWNVVTEKGFSTPLDHAGEVDRFGLSLDGHLVITRGKDTAARVWSLASGQPVSPPLLHSGMILSASFSPDCKRVVTTGSDKAACIWDARTGGLLLPPILHDNTVATASFSPDGRWLVTGCHDKTARVWDSWTGEQAAPPLVHADEVKSVLFSADGRSIVTASRDGTARIWDCEILDWQTLRHPEAVLAVDCHRSNNILATTCEDKAIRLWNEGKAWSFSEVRSNCANATWAALSPDGRSIAISDRSGAALIRAIASGERESRSYLHEHVSSAVFSPDGNWLLTVGADRAGLWNTREHKLRMPFLEHRGPAHPRMFSPDSHLVVTTGIGQTVAQLWDIKSGREAIAPLDHADQVNLASFSPDGRRVVTASDDCTARVWDALTGRPITPPLRHTGGVWAASFSPDGRRVVTTTFDHKARVWDVEDGEAVTPILPHVRPQWAAVFSPDNRRIAIASAESTVQLRGIAPDSRPADLVWAWAQLHSGHHIDDTGACLPLSTRELVHLIDEIRAKYPSVFECNKQTIRRWREAEIADAIAEGNLAAAEFHFWSLAVEHAAGASK